MCYQEPISPVICPNIEGRIREGEDNRGNNSEEENKRKRSRSPRGPKQNQNETEEHEIGPNEESEIVIPESNHIPNTPTVE